MPASQPAPSRQPGQIAEASRQLAAMGRHLLARGLLSQTSGNMSIRISDDVICITPSSMPYDEIGPADIVVVDRSGHPVRGTRKPSSETPLHCLAYRSRPDVSAIVHTHSPMATTLAILGTPIPAVHYMIAVTGVTTVPVAEYATYGTEQLARNVRAAFGAPARAVLLANHGLVTAGPTLADAAFVAEAVETLAGFYYRAIVAGAPNILSPEQMAEVMAKYQDKEPAAAAIGAPARPRGRTTP